MDTQLNLMVFEKGIHFKSSNFLADEYQKDLKEFIKKNQEPIPSLSQLHGFKDKVLGTKEDSNYFKELNKFLDDKGKKSKVKGQWTFYLGSGKDQKPFNVLIQDTFLKPLEEAKDYNELNRTNYFNLEKLTHLSNLQIPWEQQKISIAKQALLRFIDQLILLWKFGEQIENVWPKHSQRAGGGGHG